MFEMSSRQSACDGREEYERRPLAFRWLAFYHGDEPLSNIYFALAHHEVGRSTECRRPHQLYTKLIAVPHNEPARAYRL